MVSLCLLQLHVGLKGTSRPFSCLRGVMFVCLYPSFSGQYIFLALILKYLDSTLSDFSGDAFSHLLNCVNFESGEEKGVQRESSCLGALFWLIVPYHKHSSACLFIEEMFIGRLLDAKGTKIFSKWSLLFRSS